MRSWDLYLVTEQKLSANRSTLEVVRQAVAGGADVVQLREKNLTSRQKYKIGCELRKITADAGVELIVNDDLGLAQALEADGVHLGDDDLPVSAARKVLSPEKIIGVSTSNLAEIKEAKQQGADYVGFGAIYKTTSKDVQSRRQEIGLKKLKAVSSQVDIPIVAIGGINENNVKEVIKAGADTAALISAITQAKQVRSKVRNFIKAVELI